MVFHAINEMPSRAFFNSRIPSRGDRSRSGKVNPLVTEFI